MRVLGMTVSPVPRLMIQGEPIPLGREVLWSHRAAVMRWHRRDKTWILTEGIERRGGWRPQIAENIEGSNGNDIFMGFAPDPFYSNQRDERVNKSILVWPEAGAGVVVGLVRRAIGTSWSASGGTGGLFDDSFEPGGFAADAYMSLYAVKERLSGVDYMLIPWWAGS